MYPALPQGWEAKYEPTSRRWYFINHYTKTTQWEDPRTVQVILVLQSIVLHLVSVLSSSV